MAIRETKTISIQPGLNEQLANFPEVNWSAIACRAFELKLVELQNKTMTANYEEVAVTRLRASKMRALDRLFSEGESAGIDYALKRAEYLELERLANCRNNGLIDFKRGNCSFKCLAHIMSAGDGSESDTVELMRDDFGDDINQSRWIEGFVEGAVSKYNAIRSRL